MEEGLAVEAVVEEGLYPVGHLQGVEAIEGPGRGEVYTPKHYKKPLYIIKKWCRVQVCK